MKTLKVITEKHQIQEILHLSPSDVKAAIDMFIASQIKQFETGWTISSDNLQEAVVICSKWMGFTCQKCLTAKTTKNCQSKNCNDQVCEETGQDNYCCGCAEFASDHLLE